MEDDGKTGLKDAYALSTPDDSRRLYRDWAATYDEDFAAAHGYEYHKRIAAIFEKRGGTGPVLDIGCGTGLVGEALSIGPIDGVDISAEMLDAARAKGAYRDLFEVDLTTPLSLPEANWRGVVSAGAFTHGHLGPEPLAAIVSVAAPGALFVIGVNARFYEAQGFADAFRALVEAGRIEAFEIVSERVYAEGADHEHADDLFHAALFRRV